MSTKSYYIHPDQLRVGLYIHLDLGWMDHPFAFSNFKIKDEEQIDKIQALGLKQLRYDPLRSDCEPLLPETVPASWAAPKVAAAAVPPTAPALNPQQRSERLKELNDIIVSCERKFVDDAHRVQTVTRNLSTQPVSAREEAEQLVDKMVSSVLTESDVALHAISSNFSQQENYVHSLNVTVLALMLAKALDMSDEDARELGVAAVFHDVGKNETPLNKSFIDMHCEIGSRLVLQAGLSERISRIILQHHEFNDGSGYPKHLKEAQIDPLARVLVAVNSYENLCNPANPADALTPYEALSHMYVTQPQKYDPTILRLLIKSLGVYPPGSIVQLSNGLYGIVMTVNQQKPLLPFVMLHEPGVSHDTPLVVDLSEEGGVSIKRVLRPLQLPQDAFDYLRPRKRVCYYFLDKRPEAEPQKSAGQQKVETAGAGLM